MSDFIIPNKENLVIWCPGTAGSGSTLRDYSGNGNNGSITGAVWDKNSFNGSYNLTFTNDLVTFPSTSTGQELSFFLWVKASSTQPIAPVILAVNTNTTLRFYPEASTASLLYPRLQTGSGSSWDSVMDSTGIVADDTWHSLGFTVDGVNNIRKIYIDGKLNVTSTDTVGLNLSGKVFRLGQRFDGNTGYYYNGGMGFIALWSDVLSDNDFLNLHKQTYRN